MERSGGSRISRFLVAGCRTEVIHISDPRALGGSREFDLFRRLGRIGSRRVPCGKNKRGNRAENALKNQAPKSHSGLESYPEKALQSKLNFVRFTRADRGIAAK